MPQFASQPAQFLSLCALAALACAALNDLRARRVPNWLCAAVAAAGLAGRAVSGGLGLSLLLAAGVFVLLTLLWLRGWLGGGDVKLLAACALAVPAGSVGWMLVAVTLFGGVMALIYVALLAWMALRPPVPAALSRLGHRGPALRRLLRVEAWRIRRRGPLPYACAIAAGCAFTVIAG